jgi:cystathionine gamma-synthase
LSQNDDFAIETLAVHLGRDETDQTGALVPPIHPAAAFERQNLDEPPSFTYSRRGNPTRRALETALAVLHGGTHAFAFGSGMAAVTAASQLLRAGDRVIFPEDFYGNTHRLYTELLPAIGIVTDFVDLRDLANLDHALEKPAALVWLESPTNPRLQVLDLAAIARRSHDRGALVAVDNSFASPYFQKPLGLGADIVVESTTKYLNGHDDIMGGAVIVDTRQPNGERLVEQFNLIQYVGGAVPSPFDCWLLLRGMKTLAVRMERHQENAMAIASFLFEHPAVAQVNYPGLPSDPGHELARAQMTGFSGMISFEVKGGATAARQIVSRVNLFRLAGGLGGVESLISHPGSQSSASQAGTPLAVSPGLVRLSVGIEHKRDLIADLEQALIGI